LTRSGGLQSAAEVLASSRRFSLEVHHEIFCRVACSAGSLKDKYDA
jgi:hypothetical protein